ncbi:ferredoxin [Streptomyces sp. NPDC050549]|uniref:ferredoxin n=1 Tax=Streptomyces sp. NPDC050549 TaxID=3155406 RepID=UPI00343D159F
MTRTQADARAHVLAVDFAACDGHGLCAELLPELVGLDEWGYPVLHSPTVPAELLPHARRAVAACPVMALRLDRVPTPPPDRRPSRGTTAPRPTVSHGQPG